MILVALRFGLRELRGGLRGFAVFIACLALGVAAIAGVGSFARSLSAGVAREGRVILGGDDSFSLVHRRASPDERAYLDSLGRVSAAATLRAMARRIDGQDQSLVEIKAVDGAYPLYGAVRLEGGGTLDALAERNGVWGAVVEPALLLRLGLEPGDRVRLGRLELQIRGVLRAEPDRLAGAVGFGPRLMLSIPALEATGLLQPGALVTWRYRIALDGASDSVVHGIVQDAHKRFPAAGWEARTRDDASPGLQRNIKRFSQFLTLVGLTALIVGGVGVANAVSAYLDGKRDVIATLKCLGATGRTVFAVYLTQILALAGLGIAIGLAIGAVLPPLAASLLADVLPLPLVAGLYPRELLLAVGYGGLTALAFSLWPLGRARDVPVSALFRDRVAPLRRRPRMGHVLAVAGAAAALALLAILLTDDRRIAGFYVAGAAAAFALLHGVAFGIMALARRSPRSRLVALRLAVANVHRPGALTPSVVLSLGLGLTLVVAIAFVDGSFRRELTRTLPDQAPSFFFIDVPSAGAAEFASFLRREAPDARIHEVPFLRGRIVSLKGIRTEELRPRPEAAWVLSGDRGLTFAEALPPNARLVSGSWWPADYKGPPLVSFEARLARDLGLQVGDRLTVNVLGRNVEAEIANLREVQWETLGINFVMVFSPNAFAGAPYTQLVTLTYPDGGGTAREVALLKKLGAAFPNVTSIRVKEALEAVNGLVARLAWAIRGASAVTVLASVLVLAGALAAGRRSRIYDAVILKTLGATRARLLTAFSLEYLILGLVTALFGLAAGALAASVVVERIMDLSFVPEPGPALAAALAALLLTVALGLVGAWRVLGAKPGPVLRNL